MKIETITLTPAKASELLKRNTNNRNVKKQRIVLYVNDILNNNWKLNGESIKVSKDGVILDGQHRLIAVVKANKSIETLLITDLQQDVLPTIDTGSSRTGGDVLNLHGITNSNSIAGGINKFYALYSGKGSLNQRRVCTNSATILEYNSKAEYYNNLHSMGAKYYTKWYRIITISDFIGYYAYFNTKYSQDIVDSFFESILNRTGVGALLYDKLLQNTLSRAKISGGERNALIIKAFVYHVKGKTPKLLRISHDEALLSI